MMRRPHQPTAALLVGSAVVMVACAELIGADFDGYQVGSTGANGGGGGGPGGQGGAGGGGEGGCPADLLCAADPFARSVVSEGEQYASGLLLADDGTSILLASYRNSIDLGGGLETPIGGQFDFALARYDAKGEYQEGRSFGSSADQLGSDLAYHPSGFIVVAGFFSESLVIPPATELTTSSGSYSAFLSRLDEGFEAAWARAPTQDFPNSGSFGVAVDPETQDIAWMGHYLGELGLGGDCDELVGDTGNGLFVARLDSAGSCRWLKGFKDPSTSFAIDSVTHPRGDIAFDHDGDVLVTGAYTGVVSFGTNAQLGGNDWFVIKLSGGDGSLEWEARMGDGVEATMQTGRGLAVDGSGDVWVVGDVVGTMNVPGTSAMESAGGSDIAVFKLRGSDGEVLFDDNYGDSAEQSGWSIASDSAETVLVAAAASGSFSVQGQSVGAASGDVVLLGLDLQGALIEPPRVLGSAGGAQSTEILAAARPCCLPVLAGRFAGEIDLSGKTLAADGPSDFFLTKVGSRR